VFTNERKLQWESWAAVEWDAPLRENLCGEAAPWFCTITQNTPEIGRFKLSEHLYGTMLQTDTCSSKMLRNLWDGSVFLTLWQKLWSSLRYPFSHRETPRHNEILCRQVVVESVFEDLTLKKELFNSMGGISKLRAVPPDQVLLCSNTMAIPMSDITEEVCKEYRGSCIGMRFLHPVWFIDEVELTDCDYTRRTTSHAAEKLLKQLFFLPFFYDGCYRRKLTLQEISTYQSRQRLRCPEPMKAAPKRGIRKKFGSPPSSEKSMSGLLEVSSTAVDGSHSREITVSPHCPAVEELEPCAVCLEEPRWALLVPCGHMAMCIECAEKVLHGTRPICVVCRQPIERILRAAPPP